MIANPLQAQFLNLGITKTLNTAMPVTEKRMKILAKIIMRHIGRYIAMLRGTFSILIVTQIVLDHTSVFDTCWLRTVRIKLQENWN